MDLVVRLFSWQCFFFIVSKSKQIYLILSALYHLTKLYCLNVLMTL